MSRAQQRLQNFDLNFEIGLLINLILFVNALKMKWSKLILPSELGALGTNQQNRVCRCCWKLTELRGASLTEELIGTFPKPLNDMK